ncbi:RNI-like protein, partial [Martensiomyces pterosporus]
GGLVRVIDLSLLNGRWERVGYNHLSQILRSCHHIHTLNINLCQYITGDEFKRLFSENPHICRSLTALDIGETQFSDRVIEDVVRMLPNLKSLGLSETATTNRTMDVIAECLPGLEDLDISQCEDVDDDGVARMIEKCKKLKHIDVDGCPMIQDYDPISHLNATWDWESDYESATGDEFDVYDEMYD